MVCTNKTLLKTGQNKIKLILIVRVANIAPPDYRENSELMQSLTLAVEGICKQIALRRLSIGE
ncbi:MAG: hypothetical protein WBA77_05320 [Microcoleaceae cyanobacterium]